MIKTGTKLVFRSTRDGGEKRYKNLYTIENLKALENGDEEGEITRLRNGPWIDTHCEWSPSGEWIVFASNRQRTTDDKDDGLDTGFFAVYLVKADDPDVCIRVIGSRGHDFAGHVNHPFFNLVLMVIALQWLLILLLFLVIQSQCHTLLIQ